VRVRGRSEVFAPGTTVALTEITAAAERVRPGGGLAGRSVVQTVATAPAPARASRSGGRSPLLDEVQDLSVAFDVATDTGDVSGAVRAVLAMENALVSWSRDTAGTDEIDRARSTLQALIVRLGELVPAGAAAAGSVPDPIVALLVEVRAAARAGKDYAMGDRIRDVLIEAGIELRDGPDGTTWGPRG